MTKIKDLTPDDILRMCAVVGGFKRPDLSEWNVKEGALWYSVPLYTSDYNAILGLIQKLDKSQLELLAVYLSDISDDWTNNVFINLALMFKFTPLQLCQALLVAMGMAEI